jgi:hypothetical protein
MPDRRAQQPGIVIEGAGRMVLRTRTDRGNMKESTTMLRGCVSFLLVSFLTCALAVTLAAEPDTPTAPAPAASTVKPKPPPVPNLAQSDKRSIIDEDPRLKRTVSVVIRDDSVSALLAKLTELTAVKLEVSPQIAGKKLTVIGRGTPVVTIMAQVGYLFDWGWQRLTDKDEIAYRLQERPGTRRHAQELRDRIVNTSVNRAADAEWQKTQPILDAWVTSGGDIDAVRDLDPSMAETIQNDPQLEYKLNNLAAMPAGARYSYIVQQLRAANRTQSPDVAYGLVKEYAAANSGSGDSSDPALSGKVSLKLADGASLSGALEAFAKAAHFSIVADSYDRNTALKKTEWKDTSIGEILDSITNDAGYDWIRSGSFLRCRNRTWFLDELRAIPESVARQWKALKERQGRLVFQDYVGLVSSFTDDQLSGLADSGDKYSLSNEAAVAIRYLPYFRFFGQLSSGQSAAVWDPAGLALAGMSAGQQADFIQLISMTRPLTSPYWAPGVVFYARQRGSQGYDFVLSFEVDGRVSEIQLSLSRSQANPPPTPTPAPAPTPTPAAPAPSAGDSGASATPSS